MTDICTICHNTPNRPVRLDCNHEFCYICIKGSIQNDMLNCAVCRRPFDSSIILNLSAQVCLKGDAPRDVDDDEEEVQDEEIDVKPDVNLLRAAMNANQNGNRELVAAAPHMNNNGNFHNAQGNYQVPTTSQGMVNQFGWPQFQAHSDFPYTLGYWGNQFPPFWNNAARNWGDVQQAANPVFAGNNQFLGNTQYNVFPPGQMGLPLPTTNIKMDIRDDEQNSVGGQQGMQTPTAGSDVPTAAQYNVQANFNVARVKFFWLYSSRGDGWWRFDQRCEKDIEDEFLANKPNMEMYLFGKPYILDFVAMRQWQKGNLDAWRQIKRVTSSEFDMHNVKGIAGCHVPNVWTVD